MRDSLLNRPLCYLIYFSPYLELIMGVGLYLSRVYLQLHCIECNFFIYVTYFSKLVHWNLNINSYSWSSRLIWILLILKDYHPSRVLTLVYQPFAVGTMVLLAYNEAKIDTRKRNLFGFVLFFASTFLLIVVSTITLFVLDMLLLLISYIISKKKKKTAKDYLIF